MRSMIFGAAAAALLIGVPASAADEAKPAQSEKLICKRFAATGSLIRKEKRCFTRQQWDQIAESEQTGARKMVSDLQGRPAGQ